MGEHVVSSVRIPVDPLTGHAPDRRARSAGRGERGARRQGGGVAGGADPDVRRVARSGSLLRVPPGCGRAPAASPALDRHTRIGRALGAALPVALTFPLGHRASPPCSRASRRARHRTLFHPQDAEELRRGSRVVSARAGNRGAQGDRCRPCARRNQRECAEREWAVRGRPRGRTGEPHAFASSRTYYGCLWPSRATMTLRIAPPPRP